MPHLIIGGSTGDFYRIDDERNTNNQITKYFINPKISALEIMLNDEFLLELKIDIEKINVFSHCSIHAPEYAYQDDQESNNIFKHMEQLCSKFTIKNIVIHPDKVIDRSIFNQYKNLPFSIENMDERKTSCQGVEDLAKIFEKAPNIKFTLDLQHAFVNDPTMQLAKDLHIAFGDRLVEYHISGFDKKLLHYPLFKTQQKEIIQAIERADIPIIIESTFDNADELEKEIEYIKNNIKFKL